MGLFNFDKQQILGKVFQAASNVFGSASKALDAVGRTATNVSKAASAIGRSRPTPTTARPTATAAPTSSSRPAAPVAPVQTTPIEPALPKPILPGSDRPQAPIAPEPLATDAGTIQQLMAEIEKLKKERDFLLQQNQAPKESKPFGAASISADASTFEQQMDVAAAIDAKRAANPQGNDKELRQQAIDEYYYPEDEEEGIPDNASELAGIEPGPIPF